MNEPVLGENPYRPPSAERYSPKLTGRQRDMLLSFLDFRTQSPLSRPFFRNVAWSARTLPFAVGLSVAAAGAVQLLRDFSLQSSAVAGALAFVAAIAGALFRDYLDASATQTLQEVVSRIIDFDEVERLLYDRSEPIAKDPSAEEPLAAIPIDDESAPLAVEGDAGARSGY